MANEEDTFSFFRYKAVGFHLRDNQNHSGYVGFGQYEDKPEVDVKQLSFVAETVAADGEPASFQAEDQVWFQESSANLSNLTSSIFGKIRIRELNGKEQATINNHRTDPESKLVVALFVSNGI